MKDSPDRWQCSEGIRFGVGTLCCSNRASEGRKMAQHALLRFPVGVTGLPTAPHITCAYPSTALPTTIAPYLRLLFHDVRI